MAHLVKSIIIHAPISEVTALAFDPQRWHTWFSGLSEPEQIDGTGEAGTVVVHSYLMAGIRFPVITRVVTATRTDTMARWEATIEGPFDGRHYWSYTAIPEGVQVEVEMDYTIPVVLLGKFVDKLLIERIQARAMQHTLENLKLLCEPVTA